MNIELKVSEKAKEYLIDSSFDNKYGARPLKRAIQNKIEDSLAEEILLGNVKKGDTVNIGIAKDQITVKRAEG